MLYYSRQNLVTLVLDHNMSSNTFLNHLQTQKQVVHKSFLHFLEVNGLH